MRTQTKTNGAGGNRAAVTITSNVPARRVRFEAEADTQSLIEKAKEKGIDPDQLINECLRRHFTPQDRQAQEDAKYFRQLATFMCDTMPHSSVSVEVGLGVDLMKRIEPMARRMARVANGFSGIGDGGLDAIVNLALWRLVQDNSGHGKD
ncbi:MAG TPA: hypothetical protein VMU04_14115 [Candidatus Acidoferrum sp.]|nr:hypothetical protein [Candidatus Acidoferrum sp.]